MDVLLHVAGFVANMSIEKTVACICKEVSSALVLREPGAPGAYFDVCCTLTTDDAAGHIIADAQASDENGLMASFKGMVFQQVQLDKISKAFEIASRRISQGTSRSVSKKLPSLNTASLSSSSSQSTKVAEQIVPGGKDAPLREISTTSANIRTVIAQTCGADPSALHPEAKLEQLGFDSLLLIELEGQLLTVCPSINSISSLAGCVTVRDVERLCGQHEATDTPSIPAGTKIAPMNEPVANEDALDVQSTTRRIIAETCSVDCSTIDSNSELVALGIDSLMFYELESSLAGLCQDGNLSTSQLSECRTVGDVENLVSTSGFLWRRQECQQLHNSNKSDANKLLRRSPIMSSHIHNLVHMIPQARAVPPRETIRAPKHHSASKLHLQRSPVL
jgi:acyl carrier protein